MRRQSKYNPWSHNHATNDRMLRHKLLQSGFFTDTMFATNHKSTKGNKCCQVLKRDKGYINVHPMKSQDEFDTSLHRFCKGFGVPVDFIVDGFISQKKPSFKRFCD